MPFATTLIAISWESGKHAVHSEVRGDIDLKAIGQKGQIRELSEPGSTYYDGAVVLSKKEAEKLLIQTGNNFHAKAASDWYASLPQNVLYILAVIEEWESCCGD